MVVELTNDLSAQTPNRKPYTLRGSVPKKMVVELDPIICTGDQSGVERYLSTPCS